MRNNIIKIGTRALNEKDLGFEGVISAFNTNEFHDSDWFEWTDRFDKYNLTVLESNQGERLSLRFPLSGKASYCQRLRHYFRRLF